MSADPILWSTKLFLAITTPSALKTGTTSTANIYTFERMSISRSREQRTIHSVAGARKGFTTVEGDFTITISLPETDPSTPNIEMLYASNQMFDIVLAQMPPATTTATAPTEWQIKQVVAYGCMFENVSTSYDANDKPMREYTAKFLKSGVKDTLNTETTMRDGNYAVGVITVSLGVNRSTFQG